MRDVRNSRGNWISVCENCRDEYYTYCDECEEYWPNDCVSYIDGVDYCDSCRDEYCERCEECGEWHRRDNMYRAKIAERTIATARSAMTCITATI